VISAGRFERNLAFNVKDFRGMLGKVFYVTHGDPIEIEVIA